jgi:type IX secretion system PorP/SprF family membrane protein
MKTTIKFLALFVALFSAEKMFGQQDPMYSQYVFSGLIINPAYAGTNEVLNASFLYRNQWVTMEGAPKTSIFSIDAPFRKDKVGLGMNVVFDKVGINRRTSITAAYSYKLKFENSALALGVQAGIGFNTSTFTDVKYSDAASTADNAFAQNYHETFPDFGFGMYYYTNKFYAGFSIPDIAGQSLVQAVSNGNTSYEFNQVNHYFITAGYVFDLNKDLKFKPSSLIRIVRGAPMEVDFNGTFWFYDLFSVGASYRSLASVNFFALIRANKQLNIGYAFEYATSGLRGLNGGTHELMLNYQFDFTRSKIVTPRYF